MCACDQVSMQAGPTVDIDRLRLQLSSLSPWPTLEVFLTGGEPLLIRNLTQAVRTIREAGVKSYVITNGALLDECAANRLVRAGLNGLILSLDGPEAALHDCLRGYPGLFNTAVSGAIHAAAVAEEVTADFTLRVNTVVSRYNCEQLEEFVPVLREMGIHQWSLIPVKDNLAALPEAAQRAALETRLIPLADQLRAAGIVCYPEGPGRCQGTCSADRQTQLWGEKGNQQCRVLEHVAFVDVPGRRLAACNLTIYRSPEVVTPFDWESESLLSRWSDPAFADARRRFQSHTDAFCRGCEPENRSLHRQLEITGPAFQS